MDPGGGGGAHPKAHGRGPDFECNPQGLVAVVVVVVVVAAVVVVVVVVVSVKKRTSKVNLRKTL